MRSCSSASCLLGKDQCLWLRLNQEGCGPTPTPSKGSFVEPIIPRAGNYVNELAGASTVSVERFMPSGWLVACR